MVIFRREPPPTGGVKCRWGRQKLRFWAYIWLHCVLLTLRPARCYQHDTNGPRYRKLWHFIAGSKWRRLLIAGDDDKMFMTRSLNVTPKTTEQHLIARSDKYVAYVTSNKRHCSEFCTIAANYWQTDTKHRAASLRQQSYLSCQWHCRQLFFQIRWIARSHSFRPITI